MDDTTRALRRAHKRRYRAKARKLYPHDPHATMADHLACCSCPCCGNPRRHGQGAPWNEHRALIAWKDAVDDATQV